MDEPVFLSLGTNLGDRLTNLQRARESLCPDVIIVQSSPIYMTEPWGYVDQPEFLNQVVEVSTQLEPLPLLHFLKAIESKIGRSASFRYGPRLIDLDILFYGDRIVKEKGLQIPHRQLPKRAFVLVPLNDIAPHFVHPLLQQTVSDLLANVDTEGVISL